MEWRRLSRADKKEIRHRLAKYLRQGGPHTTIRFVDVRRVLPQLQRLLDQADLMVRDVEAESQTPGAWWERYGLSPKCVANLTDAFATVATAWPEVVKALRRANLDDTARGWVHGTRVVSQLDEILTTPSPAEIEADGPGRPPNLVTRAVAGALARDLVGRMTYRAAKSRGAPRGVPTLPLREASWFVWLVSVLAWAVVHPDAPLALDPRPRASRTLLLPVVTRVMREYERQWSESQRKATRTSFRTGRTWVADPTTEAARRAAAFADYKRYTLTTAGLLQADLHIPHGLCVVGPDFRLIRTDARAVWGKS